MNVVHRSRQMAFFSCKVTPDSFTQTLLASLFSSTSWWLFKDGWRKTEASRYGIWLRPPASCESDSICLNVWEQAKRKEPSFSSEIWSSSYLSLVEEIPRCPHRSTGQLWYGELLQSRSRVGLRQNTSSRTFYLWQTKQPFHTWVCPLFREHPIHCLYVSLKPLWRHERTFFMFWCYPRGFWCSLRETNNRTIFFSYIWLQPTSKTVFIISPRFLRFGFALKGWTD